MSIHFRLRWKERTVSAAIYQCAGGTLMAPCKSRTLPLQVWAMKEMTSTGIFNPSSMVEAIKQYCEKTGQHVPQSYGEFCRCIFERHGR